MWENVGKCFLPAKLVLMKYKDHDEKFGDYKCSSELRLAEASVDSLMAEEPESFALFTLHVVSPEQEPPILEEDEEEKALEIEGSVISLEQLESLLSCLLPKKNS